MGPSSLSTNMDTESLLDGATMSSNSVQTALMNVSHFILGIHFCAANGHNYVAKMRGAVNKTELSTKSCRSNRLRASPLLACGKRAARRVVGSKDGMGKRPSWALWAGLARRGWVNSSCHPCRNGSQISATLLVMGFHTACCAGMGWPLPSLHKFCQETLQWWDSTLPSTSQGLARHVILNGKLWKWLRHLETAVLFVSSCALPEHKGCFLIASLKIGYSLNTGIGWMCPSFPAQLWFCRVASAFSWAFRVASRHSVWIMGDL